MSYLFSLQTALVISLTEMLYRKDKMDLSAIENVVTKSESKRRSLILSFKMTEAAL